MTEIDGKASGWKAYYNGARWDIEIPKPKVKKVAAKKKTAKTKTKAKPKADD